MPRDLVEFPEVLDTTLRVLLEARKLIESPENWCKVSFGNEQGPWCAVGATIHAMVYRKAGDHKPAVLALQRELPPGHDAVMFFNDHEAVSHADVLALFDRAIAARLSHEAKP